MTIKQKDPKVGTIQVDHFKLGYRIEGEGHPAIVIGSAIYYPRVFSKNLRKHLQLIFVDHRGFASSTASLASLEFSLDHILHDIELVRKALGLERIIIIGHSGHGYMAVEYAKKYPDSVSHVVLIAMSPDSSPQSFKAADSYFQESVCPTRKIALAKNLSNLQEELAANPQNAFIIRMLKFGPMIWYDENFDATTLWKDVKVIPEIIDYLWGKVFREIDITKGLNKLNIPVFLALGRYDYWNPPYLWEAIRSKFKDLTICIFEKSSHTPQYEESELFDQELLQWLAEHEIPSR